MILGKGHLTPLALAILMSAAPAAAAPAFDPTTIWTGGLAGLWLDPSTLSTGFQVSSGLTPQTATGQPTGFRLDRRLGLATGPELITVAANRDFSSDTGFWTKDAGVTISGGTANWAAVASTFQLYTSAALLAVGHYYEVTYTVTSYTQGGIRVVSGPNVVPTRTAAGTYTERIVAGSTLLQFASVGASTTLSIDNVSIKEVTGNHVLQSNASPRPEYDLISGVASDYFDGLDDGYSTPTFVAGTLTSSMDLFLVLKRATTGNMVIASSTPGAAQAFIGAIDVTTAATCGTGTGAAWTMFVDGVQIGGTANTTRLQLGTALGSGAYHVLEVRGLDLSTWTQFTLGQYPSFMLNADIAGAILCPAQSSSVRNQIRTYLGAKAGLTL